MHQRSWVQTRAPYTVWTFFTYLCCQACNDVCLKIPKINYKRGRGWPIFMNKHLSQKKDFIETKCEVRKRRRKLILTFAMNSISLYFLSESRGLWGRPTMRLSFEQCLIGMWWLFFSSKWNRFGRNWHVTRRRTCDVLGKMSHVQN